MKLQFVSQIKDPNANAFFQLFPRELRAIRLLLGIAPQESWLRFSGQRPAEAIGFLPSYAYAAAAIFRETK